MSAWTDLDHVSGSRSGRWRTRRGPRRRGRRARRGPAPGRPRSPNRSTAASSRRGIPVKSRLPSRNRATATSSAAISAAVARGPMRPASRAIRSAGKRASSGAAEVEPAGGDEVGRRGRRRAAIGVGQRVLDRESHVRGAQLGLEGAVHEPDGGVDDALRVDHHLDRVVGDIVEPVRLDHLQALVRERRRVDRDLRAHPPGRVAEGLLRRDRRRDPRGVVEERAAGRGQDQPRRRAAIASPTRHCQIAECSESIGRSQASGLASGSPAVGRGDRGRAARARAASRGARRRRASPCSPSRRPCPPRSAARTGRRLTTPPVATTTRSTSSRVASSSSASSPRPSRAGGRSRPASADSSPSATAWAQALACSASSAGVASRRRARRPGRRPGCAARTSTAWRPIDPVEPRSATRRAAPLAARRQRRTATTYKFDDRRGEEERIDPVEDAAVARDERPGVLRAGGALEHRFGEVAGLRGERESAARGRRPRAPGSGRAPTAASPRRRACGDDPADDALVRLRRRDVGAGTGAARSAARRDTRPCRTPRRASTSSRIQPRSGPSAAERRRRRHRRGRRGRAGRRTPSSDDVERPEDRRHPDRQAVARVRPGERADRDEDDADGAEQQAAALERPPGSAASRTSHARARRRAPANGA